MLVESHPLKVMVGAHRHCLEIIKYSNRDYYGQIRLLVAHTHSWNVQLFFWTNTHILGPLHWSLRIIQEIKTPTFEQDGEIPVLDVRCWNLIYWRWVFPEGEVLKIIRQQVKVQFLQKKCYVGGLVVRWIIVVCLCQKHYSHGIYEYIFLQLCYWHSCGNSCHFVWFQLKKWTRTCHAKQWPTPPSGIVWVIKLWKLKGLGVRRQRHREVTSGAHNLTATKSRGAAKWIRTGAHTSVKRVWASVTSHD
jgi:hypothetical protein